MMRGANITVEVKSNNQGRNKHVNSVLGPTNAAIVKFIMIAPMINTYTNRGCEYLMMVVCRYQCTITRNTKHKDDPRPHNV